MQRITCDVLVIGAGPAGLAASIAAKQEGAEKVLIVERDESIGGILQQCIHPGFGLSYFKEELTGPEYYARFADKTLELGVEVLLNTMVLDITDEGVVCISAKDGLSIIKAGSIVLAMGCRERTRHQLTIPGSRPSGVFTAGTAQRLMNRENAMIGRRVVILGSGDIGMIMARRMTLEGAKVIAVVELNDYLAGLTRNKVQCLDDFEIPLLMKHTITDIKGRKRIESVTVCEVNAENIPIPETAVEYPCDTLLLSVGLIPENELTRKAEIEISPITNGPVVNQYMQTSREDVFACGNVVHVNDLVDNVSLESEHAGQYAAKYALGKLKKREDVIQAQPGRNVRYICPQQIVNAEDGGEINLYFRVAGPEEKVRILVKSGDKVIVQKKALRVNPGEMEHMRFDAKEITSPDLTVEVMKEAI